MRATSGAPDSMHALPGVRARLSRYQVVDALVTAAVIAWFTAVVGWMVVELHAVPSATMTIPSVAGDLPAVLPHAAAMPGHPARATIRLI